MQRDEKKGKRDKSEERLPKGKSGFPFAKRKCREGLAKDKEE